MAFNRSLLQVLDYKPWRWTTPPNPDGTGGVKQEADGVFILLSPELVTLLKEGLTQTEKDELQGWVLPRSMAQCAEWHVPLWVGQSSAVYVRIPAPVWNDPTTRPPLKVRRFFAALYREATT